MNYTVDIQPSGHSFEVNENETILEAGLRNGFTLPYSCRGGACGSCKGQIIQGQVDYPVEPLALSDKDRDAGKALFCLAVPRSDLVVEIKEIGAAKDIPIKTLPCRVAKIDRLAPDVIRLGLKLPQTERMQFLAGQYIDILLRDGKRRSFSLANAPHDDALLELHIRKVEGGQFTGHVFNEMKEKAIMRIEGPLGSFFLREDSEHPLLFIAGGTGFAPIKSIIEHAIAEKCTRPISLYWGARDQQSLYLNDLAESWTAQHSNFRYIPVLSESTDENWAGKTGWVHEAVANDLEDLSGYDIYASGPPEMIDAARARLSEQGLNEDQFYFDAFTFANDTE